MRRFLLAAVSAAALLPVTAAAQSMPGMDHSQHAPAPAPAEAMNHAGHDMAGMDMPETPTANSASGSGTSLLPADQGAMHGLHAMQGNWMLMAHGYALAGYTSQSGPRGDDGLVTGSMAMLSAQRGGNGGPQIKLQAMLSLDPLMGPRGYSNLFASGETAHGRSLVDRQHPHDFFMELSARLDVPLGGGVTGFVYAAPVGEPAIGPSAFMMRRSAAYLPLAPIGHHWFDSTHITFGVVTAGIRTNTLQLESSAFRGREPDEQRWNLETPRLDSWSVRGSWTPNPHWAVQFSHARIEQPERLHAGQDERRTIASVHYSQAGVNAMLAWAAKNRLPGETLTAWLAEANWDLARHHSLFARAENVANDEYFPDHHDPLHDRKFRVTRFEAGYAYRVPLGSQAELALGGSLAGFVRPAALASAYGKPFGYTMFARLSLGS